MNLNALWNPAGVNGVLAHSRLLPAQNQVGGNYDAFCLSGAGRAGCTACRGRVSAAASPGRCAPSLGAVRGLRCSDRVCRQQRHHANGVTLATLPLPASFIKLFSVFRSGGRLFWPVYYLLTLAAFAGLARLPAGPSGSHCLPPCSCGM